MRAKVMPVEKCLRNARLVRLQYDGMKRHAGDGLQYDGVVHRVSWCAAPAERTVVGHQGRRDLHWIAIAETFDDRHSRRVDIVAADLVVREFARRGDRTIEVI